MRSLVKIILAICLLALAACSHRKIKIYEKADCTDVTGTSQVACIED